MRRRPALFLFVGALVGCISGYVTVAKTVFLLGAIFSASIALVPRAWLRIVALLSFGLCITAWSSALHKRHYDHVVAQLPSGLAHYRGIVDEASKRADGSMHVIARVASDEDATRTFNVALYLKGANAAQHVAAGNAIEFRSEIKPFLKPLSPTYFDGIRFGYVKNLHGSAVITDADALFVGEHRAASYFANLRETLRSRFLSAISPHEASMLLALLIGDTGLMNTDDKAVFKAIGAEHLLAVSGLQISLLAWLCFALLYPVFALMLPLSLFHYARAFTAVFTTMCLFWFVGLADFSQSAVRALLMAMILFLPTVWLRKIDALDALCASGFITLLWWPAAAMDLGFLLSYAAVFGILIAHRASAAWRMALRDRPLVVRSIFHAALYSLAAFLATLPIIAMTFRTLAPFGVIANIVLVPFIAITQIPAIMGGVVGGLFDSVVIIKTAAFFANIIDILSQSLASFLGGLIALPYWSGFALFLIAIALNAIFLGVLKRSGALAIVAMLASSWPLVELIVQNDLEVTVIPVGQGDATLFSFDSGEHLLIDAGGAVLSTRDPGEQHVLPTLHRKGVFELDVLVISHPDPDHILGAFAVLQAMPVKEIWHSGFRNDHPLTKKLLALADERGIPVKTTKDLLGSHRFGKSDVQILAPAGVDYYPELKANDNSLVVRVVTGSHALLWPGDLESFGENLVVQQGVDLSATILKAPHHGSNTSSSPAFLRAVNPENVIFSTGRNNRFHFPHNEIVARYVSRGVKTWDTAVDGEITIAINLQKITIEGYERSFKKKHGHYHETKT